MPVLSLEELKRQNELNGVDAPKQKRPLDSFIIKQDSAPKQTESRRPLDSFLINGKKSKRSLDSFVIKQPSQVVKGTTSLSPETKPQSFDINAPKMIADAKQVASNASADFGLAGPISPVARGAVDARPAIESFFKSPSNPIKKVAKNLNFIPNTVAGATSGALDISEGVWRAPEAIGRGINAVGDTLSKITGIPQIAQIYRATNPLNPETNPLIKGFNVGDLKIPGANAAADTINSFSKMLPEIAPIFKENQGLALKADLSMKSIIGGFKEKNPKKILQGSKGVMDVILNPKAIGAFVGQAVPSLALAWQSKGSLGVIAWLEATSSANDAADFEKKTGVKMSDSQFTQAVAQRTAINSVLEKFGVDKILKGSGALKSGVTEGVTESLQTVNENVAKKLAYDPKQSISEGFLPSAIGGAGSGVGVGAISKSSAVTDKNSPEAKKLDEKIAKDYGLETNKSDPKQIATEEELAAKYGPKTNKTNPETSEPVKTEAVIEAEKVGKVVGIDAETKLPIVDTKQQDKPAPMYSKEASIREFTDNNKERIKTEYIEKNGNVINNDSMKKFFSPVGYDGTNSRDYQKFAGEITKELFYEQLEKLPQGAEVVFTTGGTGSGKSTALLNQSETAYPLVWDLNLTNFDMNKALIQGVIDKGFKPKIAYVLRDPHSAFLDGVLERYDNQKSTDYGRIVAIDEHIITHKKAKETFESLVDHFGDKIEFLILDNRGAAGEEKPMNLEEFKKIEYYYENIREGLRDEIRSRKELSDSAKASFLREIPRVVEEVSQDGSDKQQIPRQRGENRTEVQGQTSEANPRQAVNPPPKNTALVQEASPVKSKGSEKESRAFQRIKERFEDELDGMDAVYNKITLAEDTAKAIKFAEQETNNARLITLGLAQPPAGMTETGISIAYAEKMREEGNWKEYGEAERSRSLRQTRRGQEIAAERGRANENSADHFLQQLIRFRLEQAGKKSWNIKTMKRTDKQSAFSRGTDQLKTETQTIKQRMSAKDLDLSEAQKVLDSLICL